VFLRSYVVVARRIAEVEAEMATGAENWMPDMVKDANGDGEKLLSELGFNLGKRRIGRRIKVENRRTEGDGRAVGGQKSIWRAWSDFCPPTTFAALQDVRSRGHRSGGLSHIRAWDLPLLCRGLLFTIPYSLAVLAGALRWYEVKATPGALPG
jgi:hypothetical protein